LENKEGQGTSFYFTGHQKINSYVLKKNQQAQEFHFQVILKIPHHHLSGTDYLPGLSTKCLF
jgi:hypothetical protein